MKIPLKFAELQNALFLGGANLQLKLDISRRTGLVLTYDQENKELIVCHVGNVAIVPTSNIASMTPIDGSPWLEETTRLFIPISKGSAVNNDFSKESIVPQYTGTMRSKAQVSDPTRDPVFGKGK
jgi:hypothetical protein